MVKAQLVNGKLMLEGKKAIAFNKLWLKKVIKNNETSGKITLPKELIGKEVYVTTR